MTPPGHDLDLLLAQNAWLARLARGLVADPETAEDALQDTWLAALAHGGAESKSRAWLATVLRNFVRQSKRGSARRVEREASVARTEAQPAADSIASALALQAELARAIAALDEPYRTTIYERFYEGLAPRQIARRHAVPVKTVKTRLARGLATLRARLDRESGDRAKWLSALVPFLGREHAAAFLLGALVMNSKLKLALAAAALLAVTWSVLALRDADPAEPGQAAAASLPTALAEPTRAMEQVEPATDAPRRALDAEQASAAEREPSAVATRRVGHVLDLGGTPVGDVDIFDDRVQLRPEVPRASVPPLRAPVAHADRDGRFELAVSDETVHLVVDDPRWTTVFAAYLWGTNSGVKPTIVVAPRGALSGLVVDGEQRPIEHAEVAIELDPTLRRDVGVPLDWGFAQSWRANTDERGAFAFANAPLARGELVVRSPRHREHRRPLPDFGASDLVIVLEPLEEPHAVVAGVVLDAEDAPAADAWVALGHRALRTGADGRFRFDVTVATEPEGEFTRRNGRWELDDDVSELRAVKRGRLPARLALPPREELREWADAERVVLRLGGPPLAIRGRVEDADGRPIAGAEVALAEGTQFGVIDNGGHVAFLSTFEQLVSGGDRDATVTTDADGGFALDGLLEREYALVARDPRTLRRAIPQTVQAGSNGVVLRLAPCARCGRVAGRVTSPGGEPLAGVQVFAARNAGDAPLETGVAETTGEDGTFEFASLELTNLGFQLSSETAFMTFFRALRSDEDPEHLELVLSRRCFVQVDLGTQQTLADGFEALDELGKRVQVMQFMDAAIFFPERVDIRAGKSEFVAVEETCRRLVLYAQDVEVTRIPISPVPGERIVVRP